MTKDEDLEQIGQKRRGFPGGPTSAGAVSSRLQGDISRMIDAHPTGRKAQFMSMTELATDLAKTGIQILPGESGTIWSRFSSGPFTRIPAFHLAVPTPDEIRRVLRRGSAMVASYLREPDEHHPANTWLYLCTDQDYSLEKLTPAMRRDVRRALRQLRVASLTYDELLTHGAQAFCDTRRRVGLNDGTLEEFRQRFITRRLPEVVILGAWKDNQLAGFLSITEVDDWAEINGNFSVDALRQYGPSDALVYSALSYYLVERKCRLVSYGISSIRDDDNAGGLHRYKKKVGCEARPVHRAFVFHPLLRPLVNRLTLWGVNALLRFRPGDDRLLKARGVLTCLLGGTHVLEVGTESMNEWKQ